MKMIGDLPRTMAELPQDKHGHPVPWFVAFIDSVPDFRVVGPGKLEKALRASRTIRRVRIASTLDLRCLR